jgi:galactokinase
MRRTDGIYGGRFSGAGFKGACIALVDPDKEEQIREYMTKEYLKVFPQYKDSFKVFFCHTSKGVDFVSKHEQPL